MTDREALFRAILDNPDDDTLRLIYADAVEEGGDERRAAFIRTQVELSQLPEYDPSWIRFRYLHRETFFGDWLSKELPGLPRGLEWAREPFRRGFPAAIRADDVAVFANHSDEIFGLAPIDSLELSSTTLSDAMEFAENPWRNRLRSLSVTHGLGGQTAKLLLGSTHYERLKELKIGAGLSTASTVNSIVKSRTFKQLTALSCPDSASGQTLINELIHLTEPPRLESLDIAGNRLTHEQLPQLLLAPAIGLVQNLDLSDNNLTGEALEILARVRLPHLRNLHLDRTYPSREGVRALSESAVLAGLRSLTLAGNYLLPEAASILAGSDAAVELRVLNLGYNRLGDAGTAALAESPNLRNLIFLDLSNNQVDDAGAESLCKSPDLEGLLYLNLSENEIFSDRSVTRLRQRFGDRIFL